jgi:hypothetical protein
MTEETKTYEIVFGDSTRKRLTIPAKWIITFGAVVPSAVGVKGGPSREWGIRIREGTQQRAAFAGVVEFFDITIQTQVQGVRKYGTEVWHLDRGLSNGPDREKYEKGWVAEDAISPELPEEEAIEPPWERSKRF